MRIFLKEYSAWKHLDVAIFQFDLALVIIITAAKIGGYISLKLGQPSVLGELMVGLILGPSLLDMLHWSPSWLVLPTWSLFNLEAG